MGISKNSLFIQINIGKDAHVEDVVAESSRERYTTYKETMVFPSVDSRDKKNRDI